MDLAWIWHGFGVYLDYFSWFGMVWYGLIWCGMVWFDLFLKTRGLYLVPELRYPWFGLVLVWFGMVLYGLAGRLAWFLVWFWCCLVCLFVCLVWFGLVWF